MDDVGAVRGRVWRDGELVEDEFDFEQISAHLKDETCLIWVDLCGPGPGLLDRLAGELSLDPQAVEDAVAHAERAKATRYASHVFLTAYSTRIVGGDSPTPLGRAIGLRTARVSAFVFPHGVITIRVARSSIWNR